MNFLRHGDWVAEDLLVALVSAKRSSLPAERVLRR